MTEDELDREARRFNRVYYDGREDLDAIKKALRCDAPLRPKRTADLIDRRQRLAACILLSAFDLPAEMTAASHQLLQATEICPGVMVDEVPIGQGRKAALIAASRLLGELLAELADERVQIDPTVKAELGPLRKAAPMSLTLDSPLTDKLRAWPAVPRGVDALSSAELLMNAAADRIDLLEGRGCVAMADIGSERVRHLAREGWSLEHVDEHDRGQLAAAAANYAAASAIMSQLGANSWSTSPPYSGFPCSDWPWDLSWFKPENPRRALEKAGTLIVAEIERLDRAAAKVTI